jgi:hypothetical protein
MREGDERRREKDMKEKGKFILISFISFSLYLS